MFELINDASKTKAPPSNIYEIVVDGIRQEAVRNRSVWNVAGTGEFVAYDFKVEDVFIQLDCKHEDCYGHGKPFEVSVWELQESDGVLCCDYCGNFLSEAN